MNMIKTVRTYISVKVSEVKVDTRFFSVVLQQSSWPPQRRIVKVRTPQTLKNVCTVYTAPHTYTANVTVHKQYFQIVK